MRFSRLRRAAADVTDVNMIPIMNLFVAMIPFLLMCAAFYTVGVVNATVPVPSEEGDSDLANEEAKVTLSVELRRDKTYHVTLQSDSLPEAELDRYERTFRAEGSRFDDEALNLLAWDIKKVYPKSDTAILVPEIEVFYEDLVLTMDAVRERVRKPQVEGADRIILFPAIVVSTIHVAPPEEAGAQDGQVEAPAEGGE